MNKSLVIWTGAPAGDGGAWALFGDGVVLDQGAPATAESLSSFAGREDIARVIAVVPGDRLGAVIADLPVRSAQEARRAAVFAIEDDVAAGVDGLHLAVGPLDEDGRRLVLYGDRQVLAARLSLIQESGLRVTHCFADFQVPGGEGDRSTLLLWPGASALRLKRGRGVSIESGLMAALSRDLLADADVSHLDLYGDASDDLMAVKAAAEAAGVAIDVHAAPTLIELMNWAAAASNEATNLLQGSLAPRRAFGLKLGPWRRAAILAGVLAASMVVATASRGLSYSLQTARLEAQADAIFASAFPDGRLQSQGRVMLRRRLDALEPAGGQSFLQLSAVLFEALSRDQKIALETLRFDEGRGDLRISFAYTDYNDVEGLKATLAAQGVMLEEGGARQRGGVYVGDGVVRAAP